MRKKRIYFDCAAGFSGNPSSPHEEGRKARKILEDARTDIARLVEVRSDDVVFTSGATESNALVILGTVKKGDHALYLPSAHASIVENMRLVSERGVEVETIPIKNWRVDCEKLKKMIKPQTKFVAMDAVCGETGTIWNTREVAEVLQRRTILHVDASQAPLTEKVTRAHFGADMLTFDASKVGDVRGIGVLITRSTIPIAPLYAGGGQEHKLRSGSEAPELAKRFAAALHSAVMTREKFRISAEKARTEFVKIIIDAIPNKYINEGYSRVPNILNLSFPGRDTDYLVALMDEAGFAVSTRSACETDSEDGSRAVLALTGDTERAKTTLRISWGPSIGKRKLSRLAAALISAVAFIDNSVWR